MEGTGEMAGVVLVSRPVGRQTVDTQKSINDNIFVSLKVKK
jgi:hypothetical protein